jgi:hypothetical protein
MEPNPHPHCSGAVSALFYLILGGHTVLSLGIDEILHLLKVYPPWNQPMHEPD